MYLADQYDLKEDWYLDLHRDEESFFSEICFIKASYGDCIKDMKNKGIGGHQSANMKTDTWITPPEIIKSLGSFDLDPCAAIDMPWRTANTMMTVNDNGLLKDWFGRVWLNPPYGREVDQWMHKMAIHNNGITLLFARTETSTFFKHIWPVATSILFIEGRLHFYTDKGIRSKSNAGAPSVLIAYGEQNSESISDSGIKGKHLPVNYTPVIIVGISPSWKSVVSMAVSRTGGEACLSEIYKLVEQIAPDKTANNVNYKAKIRQQLQYFFTRISKGKYTNKHTWH